MTSIIYNKSYNPPPVDKNEVLRYAGVRSDVPELYGVLDSSVDEAMAKLSYKACYREFPISFTGDIIDLGFTSVSSRSLSNRLAGCEGIILFAATVGVGIDRLIARYSRVNPTRSLLLQSIGRERVEALCDLFEKEISDELSRRGFLTRPRFSPGYGDLPLSMQRDVFSALDCNRRIGLALNDSLLMSPSKSVTAIIGFAKRRN